MAAGFRSCLLHLFSCHSNKTALTAAINTSMRAGIG